jgi:hypothetical protein
MNKQWPSHLPRDIVYLRTCKEKKRLRDPPALPRWAGAAQLSLAQGEEQDKEEKTKGKEERGATSKLPISILKQARTS